jgi:membrane-associated phospholipid phosphatase
MHPALRATIVCAIAIGVAHLLDPWAFTALAREGVYDNDRDRLFRIVGYYPTWIAMAIAFWLHTRDRRHALVLGLVPGLGGLAAEVLKLLFRRERPGPNDGEYVFRAFTDQPWSTKGLGLPSSHALVAFTGAFVLCRLFPRAWPIWILLAVGNAVTRVQAEAHFLSDVTVAAVAGFAVAMLSWQKWGRRGEPATEG